MRFKTLAYDIHAVVICYVEDKFRTMDEHCPRFCLNGEELCFDALCILPLKCKQALLDHCGIRRKYF